MAVVSGWRVPRGISPTSEEHLRHAGARAGVCPAIGVKPRVRTLGHGVFRSVRKPQLYSRRLSSGLFESWVSNLSAGVMALSLRPIRAYQRLEGNRQRLG